MRTMDGPRRVIGARSGRADAILSLGFEVDVWKLRGWEQVAVNDTQRPRMGRRIELRFVIVLVKLVGVASVSMYMKCVLRCLKA